MPATDTKTRRIDTREIRTILVPTDFSEAANNAFVYAANLAWSLQAKLVAMHVYYVAPMADGVAPPDFMAKLHEEKVQKAEEAFRSYRGDLVRILGDEISLETRIEPGYAPDQIIKLSETPDVDLIVMGTLGQESMSEKILGSVTTRVIERAHCPVMAVPDGLQYEPVRHILYASNLSETDTVVVDQLLSYADIFGATISCVHVHTPNEENESVELETLENTYRSEIDSRKLHFQVVNNTDIVRGLHRYVVTHQVDLVTLLTRRRNQLHDNWQDGLTRAFSLETDVPLLAFHEDA